MRLFRPALIAAAALAPAVATYVLVRGYLDAPLGNFVPHVWNDQTGYWHYILSFSQVAFDTGYYSANEHPAAVSFVHYDVHGPAFPMIYGSVASVVGWELETSIYFNMALVGLGLVLFCLAARLDSRQIAAVGILALAFWPILLYVPTSSQESLHQAAAMALAAIFCVLIAGGGNVSRRTKLAMLAFVLAVSLVRFSWALLVFPLLALLVRRWSAATLLRALAMSAVVVAAIIALFAAISAPGGNAPLSMIADLPSRPLGATRELLADGWSNFKKLVEGRVAGVQALQISVLVAVSALMSARIARMKGWREGQNATALKEWLFHLFNLGMVVVAGVFLYVPDGYHRLMGAHLLLSLLVMIRFRHFVAVGAVVATNLLVTQGFLDLYRGWEPNFRIPSHALSTQREQMTRHVRYQADAPSPWCNTLLLPVSLYDYRVTLVPGGIGVSYVFDAADPLQLPIKSRYVLLGEGTSDLDRVGVSALRRAVEARRLEPLGAFPFGRLYENPASGCGTA